MRGFPSRNYKAQENELYCKLIACNIAMFVREIFELGIKPDFWAGAQGVKALPSQVFSRRVWNMGGLLEFIKHKSRMIAIGIALFSIAIFFFILAEMSGDAHADWLMWISLLIALVALIVGRYYERK